MADPGEEPRRKKSSEPFEIDGLDRAILSELQRDGRRPYREIARNLGVAEATVRYRSGRLQDSGVMSISAFAHPERLGLGQLATVFVRTTAPARTAVAAELKEWPEVMYLSSLAGKSDLMLQVVVASVAELHELVGGRLAQLSGVLESETIVELEVHKAHYEYRVD